MNELANYERDGSETRADEVELLHLRTQNAELQKEITILRANWNGFHDHVTEPAVEQHLRTIETALTHFSRL